jgi:cysteine dioxygenase
MNWTLEQFLAGLDDYRSKIPLDVLLNGLNHLTVDWDQLTRFARFSPERYRRNLLRNGPAYHALLLCWRAGQVSPIHDHRGSACGVRVLRGVATETVFDMTEEGRIVPVRTRELAEGHCCATEDHDIHQLGNRQPDGGELITLHVYSPPLLVMGQYSPDHARVADYHDEVCALSDGAGI